MSKKIIFTFLFICFYDASFAQEYFQIKGLIFEKGTSQRIAKVKVICKKSSAQTISDEFGNFTIQVQIGDTLRFLKDNYQEIEKAILQKQNLVIYLTEALELQEVKVISQTKKAQQKEILDGYRSKGVFFNGNPPLLVYIFSPLTALNELIGKDANNAKRFGNYISRENAENNVDLHFNPDIIKKSVSIKDDELVEFMYLYRPKPEDVIYRNYYDDMKYVKDTYQEYLKKKKK